MSVRTATEFLQDIANHSDVPQRAAATDVDGLQELAVELGFDDVTTDDLRGAIESLGGSADDEVSGFLMSSDMLGFGGGTRGGIRTGDLGGMTGGMGFKSNSTHTDKKWPKPICDCDEDEVKG
jgi:hypothetical protein